MAAKIWFACFSPRASLRKQLRCFKSVEQSSLLRHLEASMAYGRCCSKLLLGLCGRFLMLPGIFPGFASKQQLRLRMGAGSVRACACAHLMCRCGCKYVCLHIWVRMHARMHASPYGSQIYNTHQFDPQMWGGPYPSLKMVSVWSPLCSFSVRNRTGGKPRNDPRCGGDPIRA